MFVQMINAFIKSKQEASGWPSECQTTEQKEKYNNDVFEKEGVKLEFDKISTNPGMRAQSKLMIHSFWGKFTQAECQAKCI